MPLKHAKFTRIPTIWINQRSSFQRIAIGTMSSGAVPRYILLLNKYKKMHINSLKADSRDGIFLSNRLSHLLYRHLVHIVQYRTFKNTLTTVS